MPQLAACAHATPSVLVPNAEIEEALGLEPGWILRRTGVRQRRICGPDESCSTLAIDAGRRALNAARIDPAAVQLVLLATSTPDELLPPTAPKVATALGCEGAGAIDLAGACAGFLYALVLGEAWVRSTGSVALVVAANVLSRRVDPRDRGGRAIFADGAGAVVVTPGTDAMVLGSTLGSDGRHADLIHVRAGGSVRPMDAEAIAEGLHYLRIENSGAVFNEAVRSMIRSGRRVLAAANVPPDRIHAWIPHQANLRILDRVGPALEIDRARWVITLPEWGNASAASLPTALSIAQEQRRFDRGDLLLLTAVGAGTVEAGVVLRA